VLSHWARTALCTLAVAAALLLPVGGAAGVASATVVTTQPAAAPLTLLSQTSFVTPAAPWFSLALGVSPSVGAASGLHVSLTFYGRLDDDSQLQQSLNATPQGSVLLRETDVPVMAGTNGALTAGTCVTVVPNGDASPPTTGTGACTGTSETLTLGCTPYVGICPDVYPVSVALERQGDSTPVARFTTFLTYQEPPPNNVGGPLALRVGVIVPVSANGLATTATALSDYHEVPTTIAVSPAAVEQIDAQRPKGGPHALAELAALDTDEVLDQPYVPVNVASLSEGGLTGEIQLQVERGNEILHSAGLKPSGGPWVDTVSSFTQGDGANLATGVQVAGSNALVLNGDDLTSGGVSNLTFAQPFTLDLGHGATMPAVGANATLSARFTAQPNDPVLGAEQLLASLSFVHFENASLTDARGVVVEPPAGWQPSSTFLEILLGGLSDNPVLAPVTVSQLMAQVPVGGNQEPSVRHLQSGPASRGITTASADKIATDRQQLGSFGDAVQGHPAELALLSDNLLAAEDRSLTSFGRTVALNAYARAFASETDKVSLASEHTVTLTSRRANIPITVLSSAPYPVDVVISLASDKFTFPNGSSQKLTLDRPTTSIRFLAQARGSGDRLPIDVTLRTPDGQLVIARTVLTVHSTAISFVGVALTVLAGAVLLVWWARTWRRSRRQRPRAAR
jgi:hypothetical protein